MEKLKTKIGWKNNLDKLLFIIASLYLIFMGGLWLKNQQKTANPSSPVTEKENQPITQSNLTQQTDVNNSENNDKINQNIAQNPETIETLTLPTINPSSNPSEIPPLPTNQTTISNIPLPPPDLQPLPIPSPPSPILNQSTANPSNSKANPHSAPTSIPPQQKSNPQPSPIAKVNKVPILNSSSANNPLSPPPTEIAFNSSNSNSENLVRKTEGNYTLVGLLKLPDSQSVALFKINNLTERVSLGSEIGTTGWVLMAINDKQAVVSKQNQSIYLQVGEDF